MSRIAAAAKVFWRPHHVSCLFWILKDRFLRARICLYFLCLYFVCLHVAILHFATHLAIAHCSLTLCLLSLLLTSTLHSTNRHQPTLILLYPNPNPNKLLLLLAPNSSYYYQGSRQSHDITATNMLQRTTTATTSTISITNTVLTVEGDAGPTTKQFNRHSRRKNG